MKRNTSSSESTMKFEDLINTEFLQESDDRHFTVDVETFLKHILSLQRFYSTCSFHVLFKYEGQTSPNDKQLVIKYEVAERFVTFMHDNNLNGKVTFTVGS